MIVTLKAARFAGLRASTFIMWALLIALPIYGPVMPAFEGLILPVTTKIGPVNPVVTNDGGLEFRFQYTKLRACEYLGTEARLAGYHVDFYPAPGQQSSGTRTTGAQLSQLWHLSNPTLNGVTIFFTHRCSPLWLTQTMVYP